MNNKMKFIYGDTSIWKASSIEVNPHIELIGWKVYEVSSSLWEDRTRHFSGYNITEMEGRVSSAIIEFDKDRMIGTTESGRVYSLNDQLPRLSHICDRDWVWECFKKYNQLFDIIEIDVKE